MVGVCIIIIPGNNEIYWNLNRVTPKIHIIFLAELKTAYAEEVGIGNLEHFKSGSLPICSLQFEPYYS